MHTGDHKIKLFCDSGDIKQMEEMRNAGVVQGFTTNPSLARRAGVGDYLRFAQEAAEVCGDKPLSLEVVADEPDEMRRQARVLAQIRHNVVVKIPIVDTRGRPNDPVIETLAREGIPCNVTACFTMQHVHLAAARLRDYPTTHYISIFAGRIADSGRDPVPTVRQAALDVWGSNLQIIWASAREPLNIVQAEQCLAHIITVFPDFLRKLHLFGKDLDEFARETSQMFYNDSISSGYVL